MQVVCGNCQLSFQAPDGATGLVCPICRSPLRAADAAGAAAPAPAEAPRQIVDWNGGTLDDLVSLLSAPSWSARVEVLPAGSDTPVGEVHVIAGGVSEALYDGQSTHDALDKLRAVKTARFRVEPRLPNPTDGDLARPGPDHGKLEERPLATLMRYCEDYVLTCGIEVWRASEDAKVDYRRGEIVGVTVGGIDAPERLAEVMKWSSGNYKLVVPKLSLPDTAPKAAAAPTPAVVAPRTTSAASKTIFGMPALDPAAIASAAEKAKASQAAPAQAKPAPGTTAPVTAPVRPVEPAPPAAARPQPTPMAARAAAEASAATAEAASKQAAVAKTIFGMQAPAAAAAAPAAPATSTSAAAAVAPAAPRASAGAAASSARPAEANKETAKEPTKEPAKPARPTAQTVPATSARAAAPRTQTAAPSKAASEGDRTAGTKAAKARPGETPVWTYVGVGFIFGMALLGVYRLVLVLAH